MCCFFSSFWSGKYSVTVLFLSNIRKINENLWLQIYLYAWKFYYLILWLKSAVIKYYFFVFFSFLSAFLPGLRRHFFSAFNTLWNWMSSLCYYWYMYCWETKMRMFIELNFFLLLGLYITVVMKKQMNMKLSWSTNVQSHSLQTCAM